MNELEVSISKSNSKMGAIPSISLPPIISCSKDACKFCSKKCYAKKICRLRETTRKAYQRNFDIVTNNPTSYWSQVNGFLKECHFFRFSVSGDILDYDYLLNIVNCAKNNKHCQILCFTKKFDLCNKYLSEHKSFPKNLHILFSGWVGLEMNNPHRLPEAHVMLRNGVTSAKDGAIYCSDNCFECATTNTGCWSMKKGQQVIFKEH